MKYLLLLFPSIVATLLGIGLVTTAISISKAENGNVLPTKPTIAEKQKMVPQQQKLAPTPIWAKTKPQAIAPVSPTPQNIIKHQVKTEQVNNCDPNYSGCLKMNAGDYDCSGGSGNGPNYTGPVEVYGSDPFDLDRNHDGWGCN